MKQPITQRVDFIYIFDVKDGNPNGDPDADNQPRVDPVTSYGLVTDVCLKRKIRNFVELIKDGETEYDIFIKEKAVLNKVLKQASVALQEEFSKIEKDGIKTAEAEKTVEAEKVAETEKSNKKAKKAKLSKTELEEIKATLRREFMCKHFYDVRTFGAVMNTGDHKAGQVKGPVQITFAKSVEPILIRDHSITRLAVTTEEEEIKQNGANQTMGQKYTIPYGLYVAYGFISPSYAKKSGFSEEDEKLLFSALQNMFDLDRSAARGLMSARKLIVFRHASEFGDAPAHTLFDRVSVRKTVDGSARDFKDYEVTIDREGLPESITVEELL